ncbi:MAG: hypothetical protein SGJ18_10280 [Pseudomonadota bacterium]|nr:hypothetical protein [Pseudomonadota bacterium]
MLSVELLTLIHSGQHLKAETFINEYLRNYESDKTNYAIGLFYRSWLQRGQGLQLTAEALTTTQQLTTIALELDNPYILALSLFRRGDVAFCKGQITQAKTQWEQAENLFEHDSYELVWLKYHLALAYRDLFGYQIAIPKFQDVLSLKSSSDSLKYKVIRELFFCYCYLKEYRQAYECFEKLQTIYPHSGLEIDIKLFKSHLNILKRNFRGARTLLLEAVLLARKSNIGRNRHDFTFHLAYLYSQQKDYHKMFRFISKKTDPIYKLQLFSIALERGDFSFLSEYEELAYSLDLTQYIDKASRYKKQRPLNFKQIIKIDVANNSALLKDTRIEEFDKKEISFLALLAESQKLPKYRIAQEVLLDSFYEPNYHDPKIYKLVSKINSVLGAGRILVNQDGCYFPNPTIVISIHNSENSKIKLAASKIIDSL